MTVVGFDFSTFAIHWAWVDGGVPKREHLLLAGVNNIDRCQRIRGISLPDDTDEVCLEMPWGPNQSTTRKLMAVMGAITCRVPADARVAWIDPGDLRRAIGAKNAKADVRAPLELAFWPGALATWNEHELDALCACVGWTRILEAQEAA